MNYHRYDCGVPILEWEGKMNKLNTINNALGLLEELVENANQDSIFPLADWYVMEESVILQTIEELKEIMDNYENS